ncbi:response regulator transcription factor [Pseudomaricurvus alkylphenolicus]|uniref:response regulator n=1 Tax=Pseudomaricurvus alkylphenolicus TaxID=1306991 RepID=UPI00141E5D30|nr:response regulator transcription factor [Pseudomaricurvus alkylphenolicus]
MKIALLEDDQQQADLVCQWLQESGHEVVHSDRGDTFLQCCYEQPFDMVILDWELPDTSGLEVLKQLRQQDQFSFPVLFATQRDSEEDVVSALAAGADDYLVKPLRPMELAARLEALRRRAGIRSPDDVLTLGPITIDTQRLSAEVNGEAVKLTQKEFALAVEFLSNPGRVLSREYLLKQIWGVNAALNTRTVDVHVSKVRRTLKINPDMGYCITTIYQHGYRLEPVE